ncbi:MAG: 2'-5' RNA ligase family protein [Chitinophagaceae bacterium]|nr:MAG: 2'-5' RNA ligase family protein [Chitinophagaceae bacterium]
MKKEPLILSILLEEASHLYFTNLRNQYFPKHCNYLEAHLTLFHRLPSGNALIHKTLEDICKRPKMELPVTAIKSMGNGVAFELRSPELAGLHKTLQQKFSRFLITQDRNKLWPHITIQNKVTAFKAATTLAVLQKDFKPFTVQAIGIGSWLYKNGPWEKQADYMFSN